jgi:predicted ABC-type ATPase
MIKQIVDFSREEERGAAIIQVFMLVEDPQKHIEAIKSLIADGAIIQSVDADTIRATYKGSNQDKLLELIEDGWSFTGQDQEAEAEKEA